jgi:site-specific DNA-methyltransferase (adenine-specific)
MSAKLKTNVLDYGNNLDPDASVDNVCLDSPLNSNRDYNVIVRDESCNATAAQLHAFEDTGHWGLSAEAACAGALNIRRVPTLTDDG